jgi:hypothetical protein
MANQADVYVKNNLTEAVGVVRYCLPGGNKDLDISIAGGNEEMVYLVKSQTYMTIKLPNGMYTADCPFRVSNEELLSWSTMDDRWTVEIQPNNLPPDTPTTANVDVGDVEPD